MENELPTKLVYANSPPSSSRSLPACDTSKEHSHVIFDAKDELSPPKSNCVTKTRVNSLLPESIAFAPREKPTCGFNVRNLPNQPTSASEANHMRSFIGYTNVSSSQLFDVNDIVGPTSQQLQLRQVNTVPDQQHQQVLLDCRHASPNFSSSTSGYSSLNSSPNCEGSSPFSFSGFNLRPSTSASAMSGIDH